MFRVEFIVGVPTCFRPVWIVNTELKVAQDFVYYIDTERELASKLPSYCLVINHIQSRLAGN